MVRMTTHSRHGVAALAVLLASILVLAPAARGEAVGTTAFDHPGRTTSASPTASTG